jgi:two-component system phosphate regulon sensor histidine kinase PhoR
MMSVHVRRRRLLGVFAVTAGLMVLGSVSFHLYLLSYAPREGVLAASPPPVAWVLPWLMGGAALLFVAGVTVWFMRLEVRHAALIESHDQFEAVLEAMREGVVALDARRRVLLANQSACELLGWGRAPVGEPLDAHVRDLALSRFLQMREPRVEDEVRWVELDLADRRTLLARLTPRDEDGEQVLVLSDITALRRLEAVRRDFVANVSHELRTPTTVIQANAETLLDGAMEEPELARGFLDGIYRNAQRLSLLVSDLLDLSRIESGTYKLSMGWQAPRGVIDRVVDTLADQIIQRRVKVKIVAPVGLEVFADDRALEQVLMNLIENAVKYSDEQAVVRVTVSARSGAFPEGVERSESDVGVRALEGVYALLEVRDNGPGVPPEHLPRLFERFYRVDTGRSRQQGGTGLGLAIVKHLCVAMGGAVGVRAVEGGRGSVFWVALRGRGGGPCQ